MKGSLHCFTFFRQSSAMHCEMIETTVIDLFIRSLAVSEYYSRRVFNVSSLFLNFDFRLFAQ